MVPFWASTDSGFVPNLGPHVRSHAVRRRLFIFLMTAAHISPNVFSLRNFLSNIHVLLPLYINRHSYLLYITFIRTIYILFIYITFRFTISAGLHGRPAALGPLCLLHFQIQNRGKTMAAIWRSAWLPGRPPIPARGRPQDVQHTQQYGWKQYRSWTPGGTAPWHFTGGRAGHTVSL